MSFFKRDARRNANALPGGPDVVIDEDGMGQQIRNLIGKGVVPSGDELRTYRLAVAATGEYTIFHGGTVGAGQAAIVTAINRVNEVYVRDMAVFMELIPNNTLIVYTNPATDPYTNSNGVVMLGQNQANLDAVIGDSSSVDVTVWLNRDQHKLMLPLVLKSFPPLPNNQTFHTPQ